MKWFENGYKCKKVVWNGFFLQMDDNEDLAAKFAAELCADDRLDVDKLSYSHDATYLRQKRDDGHLRRTTTGSERFNPMLKDGLWAPDLTLRHPLKFSDEVTSKPFF